MKRLYRNFASFIITVALIFSAAICSSSPLQLDISTSDTSYFICQSIWLDAHLTNIGADTVRVRGLYFSGSSGFNILITDEEGDTLKPILIIEVMPGPGLLLNPQQTYYHCFDLTEFFGNYDLGPASPFNQFTPSLAPGRYQVSAEYYFGHKRIITAKIRFEVIEPTGTERKALGLYVDAYEGYHRKDYDLMTQKLNELITSYPKSAYAERAYLRLFRREDLLERLPSSGFNLTTLRTLTNKMTTEQKQEFLKKIIKKHPETRSAKFAQQILQGW